MRHNRNIARGACIILGVLVIFLVFLLITPAHAYEGEPVQTARQETIFAAFYDVEWSKEAVLDWLQKEAEEGE